MNTPLDYIKVGRTEMHVNDICVLGQIAINELLLEREPLDGQASDDVQAEIDTLKIALGWAKKRVPPLPNLRPDDFWKVRQNVIIANVLQSDGLDFNSPGDITGTYVASWSRGVIIRTDKEDDSGVENLITVKEIKGEKGVWDAYHDDFWILHQWESLYFRRNPDFFLFWQRFGDPRWSAEHVCLPVCEE